ncbi:hypothetical protein V8E53_011542 [Lactarius tabidus]
MRLLALALFIALPAAAYAAVFSEQFCVGEGGYCNDLNLCCSPLICLLNSRSSVAAKQLEPMWVLIWTRGDTGPWGNVLVVGLLLLCMRICVGGEQFSCRESTEHKLYNQLRRNGNHGKAAQNLDVIHTFKRSTIYKRKRYDRKETRLWLGCKKIPKNAWENALPPPLRNAFMTSGLDMATAGSMIILALDRIVTVHAIVSHLVAKPRGKLSLKTKLRFSEHQGAKGSASGVARKVDARRILLGLLV